MTRSPKQLLAAIRAHPHFDVLACQIALDHRDGLDPEDYEGESEERRALWALVYELIVGEELDQ